MHIACTLCRPKCLGRDNEDGFAVTPDFAVVADGSTSKLPPGERLVPTGGRRAMLAVTAAIAALDPEADVREAVRHFTQAVRNAYPDEEALRRAEREPAYRYTCCAAVFSRRRNEVWLIGDCQCRFGGHTHTAPKEIDRVLAGIRADVTRFLKSKGYDQERLRRHDTGRDFILPLLREQLFFQNDTTPFNPFSYVAIDGFPIDPERVEVLPVGGAERVVLASDGYPTLCDTLADTEEALHRALDDDPLCIEKLRGTKGWSPGAESFDDRTFLAIDLSSDP